MNAYWNAYWAFNANGSSRGASHSTRPSAGVAARGDDRARRVAHGDRPAPAQARPARAVRAARRQAAASRGSSFLWVPQDAGAPEHRARTARAPITPAGATVDWVGTDFYSRLPYWPGSRACTPRSRASRSCLGSGRSGKRRRRVRPRGSSASLGSHKRATDADVQPGRPRGRPVPAERLPARGAGPRADQQSLPCLRPDWMLATADRLGEPSLSSLRVLARLLLASPLLALARPPRAPTRAGTSSGAPDGQGRPRGRRPPAWARSWL